VVFPDARIEAETELQEEMAELRASGLLDADCILSDIPIFKKLGFES
jgi:hypothetical protein